MFSWLSLASSIAKAFNAVMQWMRDNELRKQGRMESEHAQLEKQGQLSLKYEDIDARIISRDDAVSIIGGMHKQPDNRSQ
jgi:hypothetical protein